MRWLTAALLTALPFTALGQSTPNWVKGYVPPAAEWNSLWGSKQDYVAPYTQPSLKSNKLTGIIIPFYFFPNNPYSNTTLQRLLELIRKYHNVPVIIIINPSNGPTYDLVFEDAIKGLKGAGATVVGYVATTFGARALALVEADVIAWNTLYVNSPVDGIFFDERAFDPSFVPYYKTLYDHAHAHGYKTVIQNPGSDNGTEWYTTLTGDITVLWENSSWPAESVPAGNFVGGHTDFSIDYNAALVYNMPTFDVYTFRRIRRYVKWLYVTDDNLPNPWDTLPPYLEQEFAALDDTTSPGNGITNLVFGATISWDAGETNAALVTLTGNATMALPTNLIDGATYTLIVQQDGVGNRTLAFNAAFVFQAAISLPLTTTANKKHVITFVYHTTINAINVALY